MYEPRTYRKNLNTDRFEYARIIVEESDLWLGIEKSRIKKVDQKLVQNEILRLRTILKDYIGLNPDFLQSMKPIEIYENDPPIIKKLKETGIISHTGPMTGVAGLIAELITNFIQNSFDIQEVIVENGGDICMKINSELNLAVAAGKNSGFNNLGLKILPSEEVIGICSSSGTFGHSISFGKADLLTVISHDTTLADAWATSLANKINKEEDIQTLCNILPENIIGLLAIKDKKIAYKGDYELLKLAH